MSKLDLCEEKFKEWLDTHNYGYLHISQEPETFSNFFRNTSKRPDFLVVIPSVSIIAVDVKYWRKYKDFCFDEKEVKNFSAFERYSKLSIWYAIATSERFATWYWISNSEVLEKGEPKKSKKDKAPFYAVDPRITKQVGHNDDIHRIFKSV